MFPLVAAIFVPLFLSVLENNSKGNIGFSVSVGRPTSILSGSGLRNLYNSPVTKAERVQRHKQGVSDWVPKMYPTTHSGVRVTLEDGKKYLIHKGPGYGKASETVVTDAAHMSNRWEVKETLNLKGSKTVGDLVKSGGEKYSITENCHTAAKAIMNKCND